MPVSVQVPPPETFRTSKPVTVPAPNVPVPDPVSASVSVPIPPSMVPETVRVAPVWMVIRSSPAPKPIELADRLLDVRTKIPSTPAPREMAFVTARLPVPWVVRTTPASPPVIVSAVSMLPSFTVTVVSSRARSPETVTLPVAPLPMVTLPPLISADVKVSVPVTVQSPVPDLFRISKSVTWSRSSVAVPEPVRLIVSVSAPPETPPETVPPVSRLNVSSPSPRSGAATRTPVAPTVSTSSPAPRSTVMPVPTPTDPFTITVSLFAPPWMVNVVPPDNISPPSATESVPPSIVIVPPSGE